MIDRLADLRAVALKVNPDAANVLSAFTSHLNVEEDSSVLQSQSSDFMTDYFKKVEVLKAAINETANNVEQIQGLKTRAMRSTSSAAEKDISNELNNLLNNSNSMISKITKALQAMNEQNEEYARKSPHSSDVRIRANMHQALSRRFGAVLTEYQNIQSEYKHEMRSKVGRQVMIVYPDASGQEVDDMIDSGEVDAATVVKLRMTGTHQSLKNALADMQDKYRDIRRLENSVSELHQMFVEVAALVEHQGELLDQIEYSVGQAKDYTEKAEIELVTARKHQVSTRKRNCWITVCLVILAVCILVPVLISKS